MSFNRNELTPGLRQNEGTDQRGKGQAETTLGQSSKDV